MKGNEEIRRIIVDVCRERNVSFRTLLSGTHKPEYVSARTEVVRRADEIGFFHYEIANELNVARSSVSSMMQRVRRNHRKQQLHG